MKVEFCVSFCSDYWKKGPSSQGGKGTGGQAWNWGGAPSAPYGHHHSETGAEGLSGLRALGITVERAQSGLRVLGITVERAQSYSPCSGTCKRGRGGAWCPTVPLESSTPVTDD